MKTVNVRKSVLTTMILLNQLEAKIRAKASVLDEANRIDIKQED